MSIPTQPLFQYQACHLYCHWGIHIWATHVILDCYYSSPNAAALRGGGAQPAPSHISTPDLTLDLVGNVGQGLLN